MGCCMSNQKTSMYEVTFDTNGTAQKVAPGKGTHIIRVSPEEGETLERKAPIKPSELLSKPMNTYYYAKHKPSTTMSEADRNPFVSCFPNKDHRTHPHPTTKLTKEMNGPRVDSADEKGAAVVLTQTVAANRSVMQKACL